MLTTLRLQIFGRVQGVFFRSSMCREAVKLQVNGWVRNRSDGSVEALLQGESENLTLLIEWARNGPPGAYVDRIEIAEDTGHYDDFSTYPTL